MPQSIVSAPLTHFLLAGAALFAVDLWRSPPGGDAERTIEVPAELIEGRAQALARRTGARPTAAEREALIADYVEEEVLYREALALGLERGDRIIRRRLVQKMEFLLEDLAPAPAPTESQLQDWLDRHPEDYRQPARIELDHVYFSRDRRGRSEVAAIAGAALEGLTPSMSADAAARAGDPSMLPAHQSLRPLERIARDFGEDFALAVAELEPGGWRGPIASSYGEHLVRVLERSQARPSSLDEVRDAVRRDYQNAERHARRRAALDQRISRYTVEVERP